MNARSVSRKKIFILIFSLIIIFTIIMTVGIIEEKGVIDTLVGTTAPIIAVVGAYIAYQQWSTNSINLKNNLFDRRFEVYKSVQIYLSKILENADLDKSQIPMLLDAMQKSNFLFGPEIPNYIDTIYKRSLSLAGLRSSFKILPKGEQRNELVKQHSNELKWLTDQLPILVDKFHPYLSLV